MTLNYDDIEKIKILNKRTEFLPNQIIFDNKPHKTLNQETKSLIDRIDKYTKEDNSEHDIKLREKELKEIRKDIKEVLDRCVAIKFI
jgi:hypothetical protein